MSITLDQAAPQLRYLVTRSAELLRAAQNLNEPYAPGKWTRLQLLGHLIDSCANNHQRIVRALSQDAVVFPAYDQEALVAVQRYQDAPAEVLIALWTNYNTHLAWVIEAMPAGKRSVPVTAGGDAPVSLEQLILDYIAHLEHHLRQLLGANALLWSGLPWGLPVPA
jgi:hypothetical protein